MEIKRASEAQEYEVVSTGLNQLDRVIGGGVPFKKITEIHGYASLGKTTLALSIVKEAQKVGKECIWSDIEWSWDNEYAKSLGVDTDKLGLIQERYAESALDQILEYCEKGTDTLIVIDSIGALHTKEEAEKFSGERTVGSQASLVARFLRKVVPLLALNNNCLVVLNHEFTPIMSTGGRPTVKTSGGEKLVFHKSIAIRLKNAGEYLKQGDSKVGKVVIAEVKKNKCAPTEGQSCELELLYGKGFSASTDLLKEALESGKIVKKGQFYYIGGERIARGMNQLREVLPSFADKLL